MKTAHKVFFGNSSNMKGLGSGSVNLVVTSPPYPMIEMWDSQFSLLNKDIADAIEKENGFRAYELMHEELNKVWKEVDRVLANEGIVCINIGDATRKIGDSFQLFANHSRITHCFEKLGYQSLPLILWRKETNKPNKYMGSGMLPPSAYVTLEHEYVLVFRKGQNRQFNSEEHKEARRRSSYFWEERNKWFSDQWTDLKGVSQALNHKSLRERSAAYPFELAYRLINMYSLHDDVVLDPFFGTGTTMLAAMSAGRNSIGYEIEPSFKEIIDMRIAETINFSNSIVLDRINKHISFVEEREKSGKEVKHLSKNYGFKVMTSQEENILLPLVSSINKISENELEVSYELVTNGSLKKVMQDSLGQKDAVLDAFI